MKFYRYLNLPMNPLKDAEAFVNRHKQRMDYDPYKMDSKENLTDEVLESIYLTGLEIDFIVIFNTYNLTGNPGRRIIHSDLTWDNGWKSVSFGVNWEIGEEKNDVKFQWWDMSAYQALYPPETHKVGVFSKLHGVHYKERNHFGVPEKAILSEEVEVIRPMLVRTDIPHSIIYSGMKRMALSIRFKNLIDWDSAVNAFSPLILEQ